MKNTVEFKNYLKSHKNLATHKMFINILMIPLNKFLLNSTILFLECLTPLQQFIIVYSYLIFILRMFKIKHLLITLESMDNQWFNQTKLDNLLMMKLQVIFMLNHTLVKQLRWHRTSK